MNLKEVRLKFRELSGRHDLVDEDGTDHGANFLIQTGQKYLDRLVEVHKSRSVIFKGLAANSWYVQLSDCRSVREVWIATTTAKWRLQKADYNKIMNAYFTQRIALSSTGDPLYYCPVEARNLSSGSTPADFSEYIDIVPSSESMNTVIFAPACKEISVLEIKGLFYNTKLSADNDTNFWSLNYEDVLVMAALRKLEVFNRNMQGAREWEVSIKEEVQTLGMDLVDEESAEADQMEG